MNKHSNEQIFVLPEISDTTAQLKLWKKMTISFTSTVINWYKAAGFTGLST